MILGARPTHPTQRALCLVGEAPCKALRTRVASGPPIRRRASRERGACRCAPPETWTATDVNGVASGPTRVRCCDLRPHAAPRVLDRDGAQGSPAAPRIVTRPRAASRSKAATRNGPSPNQPSTQNLHGIRAVLLPTVLLPLDSARGPRQCLLALLGHFSCCPPPGPRFTHGPHGVHAMGTRARTTMHPPSGYMPCSPGIQVAEPVAGLPLLLGALDRVALG